MHVHSFQHTAYGIGTHAALTVASEVEVEVDVVARVKLTVVVVVPKLIILLTREPKILGVGSEARVWSEPPFLALISCMDVSM